ncbi:hypothetical protein AMECASPLE_015005, partial [Ameca splendens]
MSLSPSSGSSRGSQRLSGQLRDIVPPACPGLSPPGGRRPKPNSKKKGEWIFIIKAINQCCLCQQHGTASRKEGVEHRQQ